MSNKRRHQSERSTRDRSAEADLGYSALQASMTGVCCFGRCLMPVQCYVLMHDPEGNKSTVYSVCDAHVSEPCKWNGCEGCGGTPEPLSAGPAIAQSMILAAMVQGHGVATPRKGAWSVADVLRFK